MKGYTLQEINWKLAETFNLVDIKPEMPLVKDETVIALTDQAVTTEPVQEVEPVCPKCKSDMSSDRPGTALMQESGFGLVRHFLGVGE